MTVPDEFDYAKNTAYVAQGFKAGTQFQNPNVAQPIDFKNEDAQLVNKLQGQMKPDMAPVRDAWNQRR